MFERNDDVLYICYDNGGYMNTGVQRSSATPPAARTATTMPVGPEPGNVFGQGKFLPAIAMAHEIPYVATATVADLRDLEYKVTKAMTFRGARYIHILVPCPLGWGAASHDTIRWRGWPRKPASSRCSRPKTAKSRFAEDPPPLPVEDYLRPQKRFAHLFGKNPAVETIARLQARPTRTSAATDCSTRRRTDGKTLCHYPRPRLIAGQPHRLVAHRAAGLSRPPAALQQPVPGRRRHPGLAVPRRIGQLRKRLAHLTKDNPFPAIMGRVCYHTCEGACNRGKLDAPVGINSVERFLGDEALKRKLEAHPADATSPASTC
jgi:hypothetical protein